MTSNDYRSEPYYDAKNGFQLLVIDPDTKCLKMLGPGEIEKWYGDKRIASAIISNMHKNRKHWMYPSEIHPYERLSGLGGREKFSVLDGNYVERLAIVSERIMSYFDKFLRLTGRYDAEILATFIIATYFMELFEYAPRVLIRGGTGSGKTQLLKICKALCYHANLSGDTTEATMFRRIDQFQATYLLDEYQDYDVPTQNAIKKILKNGIIRGVTIERSEKAENGRYEPCTYDVFGPIIYVNQSGGRAIPEEVVNRSIPITMIRQNDPTVPINLDYEELEEIRNELYTVRWLWLASPQIVNFDEIYKKSLEELQDPEGIIVDCHTLHFSSRCRDILGTMYSVAKMCGNELPVLRYFKNFQEDLDDDALDSDFGRVFAAMLEVIQEQEEYSLFKGHEYELLTRITTYAIARKYEDLKSRDGELAPFERIDTRSVTNMLKDMGFRTKRTSHNKSVISSANLKDVFETNLSRYSSEEQIKLFMPRLTVNKDSDENDVVNPDSQIPEEVNRLTRTGGE